MSEFDVELPETEAKASDPDPGEGGSAASVVRDPSPADGADLGTVSWEGRTWPIVRKAHLSETEHVAAEALATKLAISRGLKDHDGKRVERAKAYARWRYRGYLAGEIASL